MYLNALSYKILNCTPIKRPATLNDHDADWQDWAWRIPHRHQSKTRVAATGGRPCLSLFGRRPILSRYRNLYVIEQITALATSTLHGIQFETQFPCCGPWLAHSNSAENVVLRWKLRSSCCRNSQKLTGAVPGNTGLSFWPWRAKVGWMVTLLCTLQEGAPLRPL